MLYLIYQGHDGLNYALFGKAEEMALDLFGGFTRLGGRGGWVNDRGLAYREATAVWHIVTDDYSRVTEFVTFLKEWFRQEAVMIVAVPTEVEFL